MNVILTKRVLVDMQNLNSQLTYALGGKKEFMSCFKSWDFNHLISAEVKTNYVSLSPWHDKIKEDLNGASRAKRLNIFKISIIISFII